MGRPDLLNRFSRDTELYFGVISTSHFVIVVIFAAARVGFFCANTPVDVVLTVGSVFPARDRAHTYCVSRSHSCVLTDSTFAHDHFLSIGRGNAVYDAIFGATTNA